MVGQPQQPLPAALFAPMPPPPPPSRLAVPRSIVAAIVSLCVLALCCSVTLASASSVPPPLTASTSPLSSSVSHLEPVLSYRVLHADNAHLHTLENLDPSSTHPLKVGNAANSIGAHSMRRRERLGHAQPFPDRIAVSFRAFDRDWSFPELHLETGSWAAHTSATVTDADGKPTSVQHSLNTYRSSLMRSRPLSMAGSNQTAAAQGWTVVTLSTDGLMSAIIHTSEGTFQVDPLSLHAPHMDTASSSYARLRQSALHGMVMFRVADVIQPDVDPITGQQPHTCGVHAEQAHTDDAEATLHTARTEGVSTLRRLLAFGDNVVRWSNCYAGDQTPHKLSVGVAADYGYWLRLGSTTAVLNSIATAFAAVNAIYLAQFNIFLEINAVDVRTVADGTQWNVAPVPGEGGCPDFTGMHAHLRIGDHLPSFKDWVSSAHSGQNALWHLFTACYPGDERIIGLGYTGTVCNALPAAYHTAMSSWNPLLWHTVAHEIGHNIGAYHSTDGGIMEPSVGVDPGSYPRGSGVVQFQDTVNRPQICPTLAAIVTVTGIVPYCMALYDGPVCGNGVVEHGEECDDPSACCFRCQLVSECTIDNPCCSDSCQFRPTNTTCNNGLGFCVRGVCAASACVAINEPFCGFNGPCAVRCGEYGMCTGSPDYWLINTDGAVCSTAPYSQCNAAAQCVATTPPPITYAWLVSARSPCSCAGNQTLTYACVSSNGIVAASNSSCAVAPPPAIISCFEPDACFRWIAGPLTNCSNDCDLGTQTRSVTCLDTETGVTVSPAQCTAAMPASQLSCNRGACGYSWTTLDWNPCSKACDVGVQTRLKQCKKLQNGVYTVVSLSLCAAIPPPEVSRECNTHACPGPAQWSYTTWSSCNATCSGGAQTRTPACVEEGTGFARPTADCLNATEALARSCNTAACPDYRWHAQPWGACSVSCGAGTQMRSAACYDHAVDPTYTAPVPSSLCSLSAPALIQNCGTAECPIPAQWTWLLSSWSTCSLTCGIGVSSRAVTCVDSAHGNIVGAESNCTAVAGAKPPTQQACGAACPSYVWVEGGYGACSAPCSGGTQSQSVTCRDQSTHALSPGKCVGSPPASSRACNTPVCAQYAWVQGAPSSCSAVCNGGTQIYTPQCYDVSVTPYAPVSSALCTGPMPAMVSSCNEHRCPTFWSSGAFTACSAACGLSGTQTRSVACFLTTDDIATAAAQPDSACTTSKPATQVSCNLHACPRWQVSSAWSVCSASCGTGISTRTIACKNFDGSPALNSDCTGDAPATTQTCQIQPCPHWHASLYGPCSKSCQDSAGPGLMNRTLTCRFPLDDPAYNGIEAAPSLCPQQASEDMPVTSAVCATDACPSFYWRRDQLSACSASCGDGIRMATVSCVNATSEAITDPSRCVGAAPPSSFACKEFSCPAYEWATGNWSSCDSFCGMGNQTRTVQCRNRSPDPSVQWPWIDAELSVCAQALNSPMPAMVRNCTQPASLCVGSSALGLNNGRCNDVGSACVCRSGFSGPLCEQAQSLSNVETNGAEFSAGIPLGEPLQVTWSSDPAIIQRVSVLLQSPAWPTGQYLAQHIQNTGRFTWTTGSVLAAGLEPGSGYTILVYASKVAHATSEPFAVADPCAYMSCGAHGTCSHGLCTCSLGFSGPSCGVGPCESALCDPVSSSCNNTHVVQSGQFLSSHVCALNASTASCLRGFTGAQCRTPPECASLPSCQHGGDLGQVQRQPGVNCTGVCACTGNYGGDQCEQCDLDCVNGGQADPSCSVCAGCAAGYFGSRCDCKYFLLELRLRTNISAWFSAFDAADPTQQRWSRTLERDLTGAISLSGNTETAVAVQNITLLPSVSVDGSSQPQVSVQVRLSLPCDIAQQMRAGNGGAGSGWSAAEDSLVQASMAEQQAPLSSDSSAAAVARSGLSASTVPPSSPSRRRLLISPANALLSVYASLSPLLRDMDSAVWQGQVTRSMDPAFSVQASDPSGESVLSSPGAPADCFQTDCSAAVSGGGGDGSSSSSSGPSDVVSSSSSSGGSFLVPPPDASSSGLSPAIVAAIVVACLVAVGALAASLALAKRRRRVSSGSKHAPQLHASSAQETELTAVEPSPA